MDDRRALTPKFERELVRDVWLGEGRRSLVLRSGRRRFRFESAAGDGRRRGKGEEIR